MDDGMDAWSLLDVAKNTLYIFDDHSNDRSQSTDMMIYDQVVMVLMMIVLLVIIALNKMLLCLY